MGTDEAAREMLKTLLEVASDAGRQEEARLGRKMTEAEAERVATMVERQFNIALVIAR